MTSPTNTPLPRKAVQVGIGVSLLAACLALCATDPETRPSIEVKFTDKAPVIDGRLEDACWSEAEVLDDFTQVLPVEGTPPSERTEVRFLHDRDCLYVGIRCFDSEPAKILAKQLKHDGMLGSDDKVKLALDTFDRQHDGYVFVVNPAGARTEGLIKNFSQEGDLWDTIWWAKARTDDQGWTAELAIPFKSLSFDPHRETWGCNVERVIRRKQEFVRWTVISRAKEMTTLADFGQLTGLSELRQGAGVEVRPFSRLRTRSDREVGGSQTDGRVGGDVTYHVTPSLTANATVNTDFAEAEVDERIVNLTRFPVFFPEKRDFFLQDSSLFNFGGLSDSLLPYYSRRIGLGPGGQPSDILAGGRLTGRIGNTNLAVLDVEQDSLDAGAPRNLFVGRASTKVLDESYVGGIFTSGDPLSRAGDSSLAGADFSYRNTRLAQGRQLVGNAWVMGTTSNHPEGEGNGLAFGGDLDYPNEPLDVHVFFRQIGEGFDPALGFVERRGVREISGSAQYTWRPNTRTLRTVTLGTHPGVTTDLAGRVVAEDIEVFHLNLMSPASDWASLEYSVYGDTVDEPFEMVPGVVIPPGSYRYMQWLPSFGTSPTRPVSVGFSHRNGEYYNGSRRDYEGWLDWRPSRHLTLGGELQLRQIRMPEGDFDVRIVQARATVAATADLSWDSLVQYDSLSEDVGLFSRIRWTYRPGSDLFLVVNQGSDYEDNHWRPRLTELMLKVTASLRF